MNDIIKALKENEKPFGLMADEMQEKAKDIGKHKFEFYQYSAGGFLPTTAKTDDLFRGDYTYRLRPDYEERPEIVECEVKVDTEDNILSYHDKSLVHENPLSCAIDNPDFIGFKYEGGVVFTDSRIYRQGVQWFKDIDFAQIDQYKVLTPTHVLFRSTK